MRHGLAPAAITLLCLASSAHAQTPAAPRVTALSAGLPAAVLNRGYVRAMAAANARLVGCYRTALAANPRLGGGQIVYQAVLAPSGRLSSATIAPSGTTPPLNGAPLSTCVTGVLTATAFNPGAGASITFLTTLVFAQR